MLHSSRLLGLLFTLIITFAAPIPLSLASHTTLNRSALWDADAAPTSPSAYDDEGNGVGTDFTTFNTTLWSTFDPGSVLTKSVANGQIILARPGPAANAHKICGVYQTVPAGDWTIITHVRQRQYTKEAWSALMLIQDTSAPTTTDLVLLLEDDVFNYNASNFSVVTFSSYTTFSSLQGATTANTSPCTTGVYLKINKVSTTYTCQTSWTGNSDWVTVYSGTIGFVPQAFGIAVDAQEGNASAHTWYGQFDFFREYSSDPTSSGQMRTGIQK